MVLFSPPDLVLKCPKSENDTIGGNSVLYVLVPPSSFAVVIIVCLRQPFPPALSFFFLVCLPPPSLSSPNLFIFRKPFLLHPPSPSLPLSPLSSLYPHSLPPSLLPSPSLSPSLSLPPSISLSLLTSSLLSLSGAEEGIFPALCKMHSGYLLALTLSFKPRFCFLALLLTLQIIQALQLEELVQLLSFQLLNMYTWSVAELLPPTCFLQIPSLAASQVHLPCQACRRDSDSLSSLASQKPMDQQSEISMKRMPPPHGKPHRTLQNVSVVCSTAPTLRRLIGNNTEET